MNSPALSIVVTIASDTLSQPNIDHLRPCLASLTRQAGTPSTEIIVPHQPDFPGINRLAEEFPHVRFLEIRDLLRYTGKPGTREHHNELRARGIAAARGAIIALTEDHAVADPHWSARLIEAHARPVAAVGGAIENAVPALLNWAVYFREFGEYQNPLRENEPRGPSDVNVSYKRSALESVRDVWSGTFEEHVVNTALRASGQQIVYSPEIVVFQKRLHLDLRTALKERWIWGKSYGAFRKLGLARRIIWTAAAPILPFIAVTRMAATVVRKRRNTGVFLKALPLVFLMAAAWSCGETAAYIAGNRDAQ